MVYLISSEMKTPYVICECGMLIKGTTKKHLEYNLKMHKRGNKHKEIMLIKSKEGESKK